MHDKHQLTTRSKGNFVQNVRNPSGAALYLLRKESSDIFAKTTILRTRLMKIIRDSGTPFSIKTSTALMALPPVASIGSNKRTYRDAISSGNCKAFPDL
jgi:hypothetical protein